MTPCGAAGRRTAGRTVSEGLRIERDGRVAIVTIDRPPANALSQGLLQELDEAFQELAADPAVKAVVVTGRGKFFSAGADLKEMQGALGDATRGRALAERGQRTFDRIEGLPKPVVAAVNGFALGGGMELLLACHVRFAAASAKVGLPETNLGLIPGYGGTQRLARTVGAATALDLILTGRMIDAAEAHRLGIVQRVVPDEALRDEALAYARALAEEKSAVSLARALRAVLAGRERPLAEGLALEAALFGELFASADAREGVGAFVEKRKPTFQDR
ncbi:MULTISPECIES: enoyl-CoA hydratase-related protein [Hydrogenibacillus]|uniref:Enoyl-CoA hydratase n=1 Tax=Hydrogenibacillus schlegelii TaxID=1484 RepID=A0A2T5G9Y9_HYDSH|nr:MAG: Enoyl-CoA hydratase [Hydrogenibacillus schlegelii]